MHNPNNFEEEQPKPPVGANDEELERWREYMGDQFDYSFELGKEALQSYFCSSFKDTQAIISEQEKFFDCIKDIDQVFILGHSLSGVDLPYFEKVITSITETPEFTVSYHSDRERISHAETLCMLGIQESQIRMIKIDAMV